MFHKLIYQKKAAFTDADARDFSTKDYTCVKLLLTKRGRPVAILESNEAGYENHGRKRSSGDQIFPGHRH